MNNYITIKPFNQGKTSLLSIHTHKSKCTKYSRCNNHKKCKACNTIWRNKQLNKLTNHLDELTIRKYHHKQYLIFSSMDTHTNEEYKNADIENFLRELITTKRNKKGILNEAQYIAIKEISYTKLKGYNPHYNFIYLSNNKFIQTKEYKKIASKYNIRVYVKDIYKSDRSYLQSIKNIINYSMKYDNKRSTIESQTNVTKFQRDIKKSGLFVVDKYVKMHKQLYKYISDINKHYTARKREALRTYKNYNKSKPSTKIRMLKSLKNKLNKIELARTYYTAILKKWRYPQKIPTYTHLIHKN